MHVRAAHAADVPFSFGREPKRLTFAVATSAVVDVAIAMLFVLASRHHPVAPAAALQLEEPGKTIKGFVWLSGGSCS